MQLVKPFAPPVKYPPALQRVACSVRKISAQFSDLPAGQQCRGKVQLTDPWKWNDVAKEVKKASEEAIRSFRTQRPTAQNAAAEATDSARLLRPACLRLLDLFLGPFHFRLLRLLLRLLRLLGVASLQGHCHLLLGRRHGANPKIAFVQSTAIVLDFSWPKCICANLRRLQSLLSS
ncbi:unnamed protein product [Effrenium voratum]|nr:unnamed protein product [Effrenium voratum]